MAIPEESSEEESEKGDEINESENSIILNNKENAKLLNSSLDLIDKKKRESFLKQMVIFFCKQKKNETFI